MNHDSGTSRPAMPARERIVRTAHDLFYRDGVRATGIDRVIAEAGVTKVTFYRHFPSKNDLVQAFLELRHGQWMDWFTGALERHRPQRRLPGYDEAARAVAGALGEWFARADFRGCAFINTVVELGGSVPATVATMRAHKRAMTDAIAALLPPSRQRRADASAIAVAVDGAIVRAQYAGAHAALAPLHRLLRALAHDRSDSRG